MKPIFTIHAGEYLVAAEIEKSLRSATVWLPSKDTGIDLLLTDKTNKRTTSVQVKFSKDFNSTHVKEHLRPNIKGTGWWTLNREKIEKSPADYWIFILYSFEKKSNDFIIIEPKTILKIFASLDRKEKSIHCYITVTNNKKAFESRGLSKMDMQLLCDNKFVNPKRDLTKYLNNWGPIINSLN
ncbi:MAG: hypothetical protein HYU69_16895 [Bacteroidetes bacterium]|nr:hypothetical protein [Bacteroidota bacterium]